MDAYPNAGADEDTDFDEDDAKWESYRGPRTAGPDERARLGAGPLLSMIATLPLAGLALVFASASAMACDACDGAKADAFDSSFTGGFHVLQAVLGVALSVLFASWVLPLRERYRTVRTLLALSAPVLVVVGFLAFAELVDWPSRWG
nr:hypothetical protein [Streptomyces sp. HPF1205]